MGARGAKDFETTSDPLITPIVTGFEFENAFQSQMVYGKRSHQRGDRLVLRKIRFEHGDV